MTAATSEIVNYHYKNLCDLYTRGLAILAARVNFTSENDMVIFRREFCRCVFLRDANILNEKVCELKEILKVCVECDLHGVAFLVFSYNDIVLWQRSVVDYYKSHPTVNEMPELREMLQKKFEEEGG